MQRTNKVRRAQAGNRGGTRKFHVPHFTGKAKIDRIVKEAGFVHHPFVIATFYYQNRDTPRPVAEARGPCDTIQRPPNSRGVSRSSSANSAARTSGLIIRAPPTDGKRGGLHYIDISDHHEFDLIMAKCNIVVGSLGSH